MTFSPEEQIISSTDAVGSSEDAPSERTETKQVMQESGDKEGTANIMTQHKCVYE